MGERSREERYRKIADAILLPNDVIMNVDVNKDEKADGFQFDLVNPFNTALPLSHIKDMKVIIDGQEVSKEKTWLIIRENKIQLADLSTSFINDVWLGYSEKFSVYVEKSMGLSSGKHILEVSLLIEPAFYPFFPESINYSTKKVMMVK